ncbi:MAG: hypothetical protein IJX99_08580 [Clostridia bacterium]|nr:hypothetical protein [Clostridia bacterium]
MVRKAIIKQLDKYFPDYDIYGEEIEQGFEEPCFFVQQLQKPRKKEIQSYQDSVSFDIQYFLDINDEDINEKYNVMGDSLFEKLEYVSIDDNRKIRGSQMSYEIQDRVLHFYVTYTYCLQVVQDREKMKSLDVKESVKDD